MNAINSARRMKIIEQFENLHLSGYVTIVNEIEQLRQRVQELETQLAKNNPLLDEAADAIDKLTAERDELLLYKNLAGEYGLSVFEDMASLKEQRDEAMKYWQIAEGRCDALKQQIDELLVALILASCCLEPNTSSATVNQIEAAIASVNERK